MKIMDSKNFEMLRGRWPELADLGAFAEHYARTDPASALIKLRIFAEQMVENIYQAHDILLPYKRNLYDLLFEDSFIQAVPKPVLDTLHQIRLDGNKAAHGKRADTKTALSSLRAAWDLARWYFITYTDGKPDQIPHFQEPPTEDT
jgi:type I restriction enzyme R subunit